MTFPRDTFERMIALLKQDTTAKIEEDLARIAEIESKLIKFMDFHSLV